MDTIILILSDARGIYIPRDFLTDSDNNIAWEHCNNWGLTTENYKSWGSATDVDSMSYWDDWDWILQNAQYKDSDGSIYRLHQDGDLWGLCLEKMTDEEKQNFGFELD